MRRALRKTLPPLSYHFGLKWADVVAMPRAELEAYIDALAQINAKK